MRDDSLHLLQPFISRGREVYVLKRFERAGSRHPHCEYETRARKPAPQTRQIENMKLIGWYLHRRIADDQSGVVAFHHGLNVETTRLPFRLAFQKLAENDFHQCLRSSRRSIECYAA